MPAGTLLAHDGYHELVVALENATGNTTGEWFYTGAWTAATIHFVYTGGTVGMTVTVHGSNAINKPDSATAGAAIAAYTIATAREDLPSYAVMPRWTKVAITNYTAGTANALAVLRRFGGGAG